MPKRLLFLLFLVLFAASLYIFRAYFVKPIEEPLAIQNFKEGEVSKSSVASPVVVAENLAIPWEIAFLSGGDLLVTERAGFLRRIGLHAQTYTIESVAHVGEGGLLGLALHPRFNENHYLYLYYTVKNGEWFENQVIRYRFVDDRLADPIVIVGHIPAGIYHNGGRIAFGPDGYLYIATGDAGDSQSAQRTDSLAGKILRVVDDGSIPKDNPFGNAVYSYGHRNPQGLAWDDRGRLWATEHGRSGVLSGLDELNVIKKSANYGWPTIEGGEKKEGMESPILQSGTSTTWAPASLAFWNGALYFGGLRGEALYAARVNGMEPMSLQKYFAGTLGRIRVVVAGSDGALYVATSNTDGRGNPREGDDRIIRVSLEALHGE